MDSKHNNDKLRPLENEHLPPELQWENMEAGILRKMEELQAAKTGVAKKGRGRWGFLALLLLIGMTVSVAVYFMGQSTVANADKGTSVPGPSAEAMKEPNENNVLTTVSTRAEAAEQTSAQALTAEAGEEDLQATEEQFDKVVRFNQKYNGHEVEVGSYQLPYDASLENLATNRTVDEALTTENDLQPTSADAEVQLMLNPVNDKPVTPTEQDVASGSETDQATITSRAADAIVMQLPANGSILPLVSQSKQTTSDLLTHKGTERTVNCPNLSSPQTTSEIWLSGGASWWSAGYGNTRPERAEFEEAILSYQGQISYVQPLKKDYLLLIGIQYQQLESRLNWNDLIEDFEVTLEDTVIQIRRNVITGVETEVRGDVTLIVPAERRVQHFNSFTLIQVPLAIGKSWGKGNLQSHLLLGGIANLSLSRQGQTLFQAELVDYDDDNGPEIWSSKLGFGAMLSGGLSYRLTDRLGLLTTLQYQRSLTNWSVEDGVRMRPSILNWSFGVRYSL
ncbi:MAG: hypothetical protein AAFP77_23865 [Bacteroidota bacterium]